MAAVVAAACVLAAAAAATRIGMPPWPTASQPPAKTQIQKIGGGLYYCQLYLFRQRSTGKVAYVERCAPIPTSRSSKAKPKKKSGYSA